MSILKEIKRMAADSRVAKEALRNTLNGKEVNPVDKPKPNGKVGTAQAVARGTG